VHEAETNPAKDERTRLIHEVYVPGFSLLALVVVTIVIMSLAVMEIRSGGDDGTSAEIMFAFASVNIVVDVTCITMFYYRKEDILHNKFTSFTGEPVQTTSPPNQKTMFSNANINMFAAFTHIGSDTLRTIAIYLAAIAATVSGYKSSLCDAWAAIAVSITIFIAIIPLTREVYFAYTGER
jgi:Co/Zn/Cd efflux system component